MIQQLTKNQTWLISKLKNGCILMRDTRPNFVGFLLKDGENIQGVNYNLVHALLIRGRIKVVSSNDNYEYYGVI